jgi:LacI family transcriptional regulator
VPEDVGVAQSSVACNETHVSGINENGFLIGRTAMDFLVGMLQRGERGAPETPIRILVEGAWREGGTVRRQKGHPSGSSRPRLGERSGPRIG